MENGQQDEETIMSSDNTENGPPTDSNGQDYFPSNAEEPVGDLAKAVPPGNSEGKDDSSVTTIKAKRFAGSKENDGLTTIHAPNRSIDAFSFESTDARVLVEFELNEEVAEELDEPAPSIEGEKHVEPEEHEYTHKSANVSQISVRATEKSIKFASTDKVSYYSSTTGSNSRPSDESTSKYLFSDSELDRLVSLSNSFCERKTKYTQTFFRSLVKLNDFRVMEYINMDVDHSNEALYFMYTSEELLTSFGEDDDTPDSN